MFAGLPHSGDVSVMQNPLDRSWASVHPRPTGMGLTHRIKPLLEAWSFFHRPKSELGDLQPQKFRPIPRLPLSVARCGCSCEDPHRRMHKKTIDNGWIWKLSPKLAGPGQQLHELIR